MTPHDAPSAQQLVEAVHEWLERDVFGNVSGRLQFHTRVAINMLTTVERELQDGPQQHVDHHSRLAELGFSDDRQLAQAIRSGELDDRLEQVRELVWASVRDKVKVANPKYLGDD